jgi:hypothetical protein
VFIYVGTGTSGCRDCRGQCDRYEAAESNYASVGIAAETFTDEIVCVNSSTLHFMKLFKNPADVHGLHIKRFCGFLVFLKGCNM